MPGLRGLLIIEDDTEFSNTLEHFLVKIGYKVLSAETGEEGLRIWEEERPRAVLLDTQLSDMSGYEVCKEIKQELSKRYTTAVVFMSDEPAEEVCTKGSEVCADFYIEKPVNPNDVGVDLFTLFEHSFNLDKAEVYRLRVTKQVPPNTEPSPFAEPEVEEEPEPQPVEEFVEEEFEPVMMKPQTAPVQPEPVIKSPVAKGGKTPSAMQLGEVRDLLLALKGSLKRSRETLGTLMNYIDGVQK
jgi:CheY-like chemotaxis protein